MVVKNNQDDEKLSIKLYNWKRIICNASGTMFISELIITSSFSYTLNLWFNLLKLLSNSLNQSPKHFVNDIDIYSIGLFPFFSYACLDCKISFLTLIKQYYLPVEQDLNNVLVGLVSSLLKGMEEDSGINNGKHFIKEF